MSLEIDNDAFIQVKELMGDKFPGLVETYLRSNREHVENIQKGFEAGDAQAVVDAAHPMKSASGNMGLKAVSATAQAIEVAAKDIVDGTRNMSSIEGLISDLVEQFSTGENFLKENSN